MKCTGECCARFFVSTTLSTLRARIDRQALDGIANVEAARLFAMLRPSGQLADGATGQWFTCSAFDRERRRCLAYDDRPLMCSEFPYGTTPCWACGGAP